MTPGPLVCEERRLLTNQLRRWAGAGVRPEGSPPRQELRLILPAVTFLCSTGRLGAV